METSSRGGSPAQLERELAERDQRLAAALGERPLTLWFEHDLYDQLQLLEILSFVDEGLVGTDLLTLIVVDHFPGRPDFKGLGELDAVELASLWPPRPTLARSRRPRGRPTVGYPCCPSPCDACSRTIRARMTACRAASARSCRRSQTGPRTPCRSSWRRWTPRRRRSAETGRCGTRCRRWRAGLGRCSRWTSSPTAACVSPRTARIRSRGGRTRSLSEGSTGGSAGSTSPAPLAGGGTDNEQRSPAANGLGT